MEERKGSFESISTPPVTRNTATTPTNARIANDIANTMEHNIPDEEEDAVSETTDACLERVLNEDLAVSLDDGVSVPPSSLLISTNIHKYYRTETMLSMESMDTTTVPPVVQSSLHVVSCCDSHNGNTVEIQQVRQEQSRGDDDDKEEDAATFTTSRSDSLGDEFTQRVGQRLVTLHHYSTTMATTMQQQSFDGTKLRLSIGVTGQKSRALGRPYDLLDVETGRAIIVYKPTRPLRRIEDDSTKKGNFRSDPIQSEVGLLGGAWRGVLRYILVWTMDLENRLRLGRLLQDSLPFLTAFECHIMAQVIEALDENRDVSQTLTKAFRNRNVSRLLVQSIGPRHDFLYHWSTAVTWNRPFDMLGQFPIIGAITRFPATENFPSTRNHALASIFRVLLGQGNWYTRVLTGGREGLITDDPKNTAQNLTAESNGFELANRNQYGTHFGRAVTNQFRKSHRLPTDESLVRTFVAQPIPTMTNNGVVHTLRQLSNHWTNMLRQEYGNFAHQRMEQLDPFETLRFHMPQVLLTLSSLRGRNIWDTQVLGPMIRKLQALKPETTADRARRLVFRLDREIVEPVSGGIATVVKPFKKWLEAISLSLDRIEQEAKCIYELVSSVELGIRLGNDVMEQSDWRVPPDKVLLNEILAHIREEKKSDRVIPDSLVETALERTTPRDKRTLIELIKNDFATTKPAKLLLARVKTLLQREIRRDIMNAAIGCLSKGEYIVGELTVDYWYWLEDKKSSQLYVYRGEARNKKAHQFLHVNSGSIKYITRQTDDTLRPRAYISVAEAITRAQKVFMTIELNYGKVFKYGAFMEFSPLRVALRRLVFVAQMACEALDVARLNVLGELQRLSQAEHQVGEPQNMTVVGGGPAGMMACLHCTENCLVSGGAVKLYEARDTFAKGGSTYERAQIVRLDSRWIAMLRYHVGTGFEDVFIPASGETDSQLGNTLPSQGFVEITIKDLENMLHVEISRFWSRGVITIFTDSRSQYDPTTNSLTKLGENLKVGEIVLLKQDYEGGPSTKDYRWKVEELVYTATLGIDKLIVGEEYCVYYRPEQVVLPFKLLQVDLETKTYHFGSLRSGIGALKVSKNNLPSIYAAGTHEKAHADVHKVVLESVEADIENKGTRVELLMDAIKKVKFTLDIGNTHVVEAIGKPSNTQSHFQVTTHEPYGVCCMEGLKVSMGMHNFGEKRWGSGIVDDIRSLNDQNTRIIGDFTKMVRTIPIVRLMHTIISNDNDWINHFVELVDACSFPHLNILDLIVPKVEGALEWLVDQSPTFFRQTLQTRFFEVGDNFYLGMEFPREYDQWKQSLTYQLVQSLDPRRSKKRTAKDTARCDQLKQSFSHSIDRLWYFACLETIRTGDVYNPGARRRVPKLHLINSSTPCSLGSLGVGESFRIVESPDEKYENLGQRSSIVIVRNVEGYVFTLDKSTAVVRQNNLTRNPDGNQESKVAIATFPVSHYINYRTMRVSDVDKGYVFAFTGDEQATPHFMRYSGLTGACVNAMSFNIFLQEANKGTSFVERFRNYSRETNWSNGEVVQRGTGSNFGEDGFLRPGFSYSNCIDYLYCRAEEFKESEQNLSQILTRDWKVKLAASIVPRGMELDIDFKNALLRRWQDEIFLKLVRETKMDNRLCSPQVQSSFHYRRKVLGPLKACCDDYWHCFILGLRIDGGIIEILNDEYEYILSTLYRICNQILDFAAQERIYNRRISSELYNQPPPVDSVVDDFAVEAQGFANSLTLAAATGAGVLALRLVDLALADFFSAILGAFNILIAFSTMTNVARYKIRNEEARVVFKDKKFPRMLRTAFALVATEEQRSLSVERNPYLVKLEKSVQSFWRSAAYYDFGETEEFNMALSNLMRNYDSVPDLKFFRTALVQTFICDMYHSNSYVQESLVEIVRTIDDVIFLVVQPPDEGQFKFLSKSLFHRLEAFGSRLESSIQRGPVRWGFIKTRKFAHWDIFMAARYLFSLMWFFPSCGCRFAPIEAEIASTLTHMQKTSKRLGGKRFRREIQDLELLKRATRESAIASLIFVVASLTFFTSIVFTVARLFSIQYLVELAFYSAAASSLGGFLAVFHFVRKLKILCKLHRTLGKKERSSNLNLVKRVTGTQILLTFVRFCVAIGASIALVFSVAEIGYTDKIPTPQDLPFQIAMGALSAAIGSTIFFFFVEYVVRYRLRTRLGPYVCNLFRFEIEAIHKDLQQSPSSSVDTKATVDRETWEYTARNFLHTYRFDTVFAADRFGQLLQYIQSEEMLITLSSSEKEQLSY